MVYQFGPFRLEKESLLLSLDGAPLALGPKVVETLLALVEHPGEVLGKTELLDRIWPEGFVEEANLAQNIYVIRKTLRTHWEQNAIDTVPRRGYRFIAPVSVEAAAEVQRVRAALPHTVQKVRRFAAAAAAAVLFGALGMGIVQVGAHSHATTVSTRGLSAAGARLYAMGKFYWNQRTETGNAKSIRYFEQVVQSDPRDGRGYAGLASAYAIEADYKFGPLTRQAALTRASAYAFKALAIDPRSAEAHAALGLVASDRQQMAQSVSEYRRALALDPYYAPAHQWYGIALLLSGKGASAYAELQKAANLDPESVAATDWLSQAAFIARRYRDAIAYGHQALDLSPQRYSAYVTLGMAYEALGNYQAAISAYEKYSATCRECRYDAAALLAHVYAVTHDKMRAEQQLKVAESGIALHETSGDNVVAALIALGRKNEALELLRRLKPDEPGALLAIDPRMDAVRGDSRFRQYVQGPG